MIQKNENKITITDNPINNHSYNKNAIADFEKIYCTQENETLLNNCHQLQAGEYAIINTTTQQFEIKTHYKHSSKAKLSANIDTLKQVENELIQKIKTISANKTILVPLSGGYDSRYLVCLLKQNNITNVECFTYGRESYEVLIAKNVAEKLNYKWHFIEYTDELLTTLQRTGIIITNSNHHYTSLPHEQDFFCFIIHETRKFIT